MYNFDEDPIIQVNSAHSPRAGSPLEFSSGARVPYDRETLKYRGPHWPLTVTGQQTFRCYTQASNDEVVTVDILELAS